eukprot:gene32266-41817_t
MQHVVLMMAAKLGLHVVSDLREALRLAECKMIYFDPVDDSLDKLKQLRKTIPERRSAGAAVSLQIAKTSYTHAQVLGLPQWYFAKKIVDREYFEVDA